MEPQTIRIKFIATELIKTYSGKIATFTKDGEIQDLPAGKAEILLSSRPDIFHKVENRDGQGSDGQDSLPADPEKKTVPGPEETKIVVPGETKAEENETDGQAESSADGSQSTAPPENAGSFNQDKADEVPQQKPGESDKDYKKRLVAWERSRK